jgi:hypothetical protein
MITVNKELEYDVYLGDWGIDLTSCFYEYNNQYQKVMSWNEECDGYNEEHFIESVKEFIKKHPNKTIYVIDKYEAHSMKEHSGKTIQSLIKFTEQNKLDITFAGGGYDKPGFPFRKITYWLGNNAFKNKEIKPRKFDKHFLYMNRIRKKQREELLFSMYRGRYLDKCYWSWASNNPGDGLHKTIEGVVIDGQNSHLENEILPEFFKSFISIVPETNVWVNEHTRGVAFPTEKTEKCFTAGQPFIAVSTPGYLRQLRSLGFRTFDGFINEDYDSYYNDKERHERIMMLIHDISTWSLEKCERIYKEMIPILKHNQELNEKYLKLQNDAGFSFIDDIIEDEVYEDMLMKSEDKQRYNPDRLI